MSSVRSAAVPEPFGNAPPDHGVSTKFYLSSQFINQYKEKQPPFGFNGLGELVFRRTYARPVDEESGRLEEWYETVKRVVEGTYNMQKRWIEDHGLGWDKSKAQRSAKEMYDRIFHMKFLPPGRGLWAMGSPITEERRIYAALNNCAFVSTIDFFTRPRPSQPFAFLMDASMLGVGVGFDTKGADTHDKRAVVKGPQSAMESFVIPDSREGWVEALAKLVDAHYLYLPRPTFDFSLIRPAGAPIRGFGGVASGGQILEELLDSVDGILTAHRSKALSERGIVDIMNQIGVCVIAGNVRRTAEISFGSPYSQEYLDLKNYSVNPERAAYGWTSNNSVFADVGMDYGEVCRRIGDNGEPGVAWLENMQKYGRMAEAPNYKDQRAAGGNPCLEQTLESFELCCLVETFPHNHDSFEDFQRTLKYAYLYAKTVTLGKTHWPETNRVTLRNRRIGCSMSGVAQFVAARNIDTLRQWCEDGYTAIQAYDKEYSEWLAIPTSVKMTSIKPSGTVSLLAGATPGMHFPHSRFYLRRVQLAKNSSLLQPLIDAGVPVEPSVNDPEHTMVASFPIDAGHAVRSVGDVSMWEQLSLAAFLQKYWSDNQVSCTITFDPDNEGGQLSSALDYFQYQLKGVSFLPRLDDGAYPQMPYEAISEEHYTQLMSAIRPLHFKEAQRSFEEFMPDRFCDGETCEIAPINIASDSKSDN